MLSYTIGFIYRGGEVLLLNRKFAPLQGVWHGVGGKLETGETPEVGMAREILEETGLRFAPEELKYSGEVTWPTGNGRMDGMYAFTAEVQETFQYPTPIAVEEGILDWKPLAWICAPDNHGVREHVKRFLPMMLYEAQCYEYRCDFEDNQLKKFDAFPIEKIQFQSL